MKKHIRKSICILLTLILSISTVMAAFADELSVTYDGNARNFVFEPGSDYSPTDLFTEFKNVMPGDTLTDQITVKNGSGSRKAKIYLKSLGGIEENEFLNQMTLKVSLADASAGKDLFDAPADQTDGLTDWVLLGTLRPGAAVTLNVELMVPITMDNSFQEKVGKLQWQFKVEEVSTGSGGSSGGGGSSGPSGGSTSGGPGVIVDELTVIEEPVVSLTPVPADKLPKTGDTTNLALWMLLMAISGGALAVLMRLKKQVFDDNISDEFKNV